MVWKHRAPGCFLIRRCLGTVDGMSGKPSDPTDPYLLFSIMPFCRVYNNMQNGVMPMVQTTPLTTIGTAYNGPSHCSFVQPNPKLHCCRSELYL